MRRSSLFIAAVLAQAAVLPAWALQPGQVVSNFRLLDHRGASHELYYFSDMKAVVLAVQANGCVVSKQSVPAINALAEQYQPKGVTVFMLNSNLGEARDTIGKFAADTGATVPVLMDELQLIGESLATTQAGEVLVIDPKTWKLAYRGSLDAANKAVDALVAGQPVAQAKTAVQGCAVNLPELANKKAHANISYAKTIAPMLNDKCVSCHHAGGIGPWQMTSYDVVKGFAPMIREVLRTERMPPWHADPHYGAFKNNRSLTGEQVKTLVHWVEAGAPRGAGPDPLVAAKHEWPEWTQGKPDHVLTLPAFTVPATGVIDYQVFDVENTIGEDVWLRAIEYAPGDRTVVHHILGYTAPSKSTQRAALSGSYLAGYVPGGGRIVYPADTGVLLKKDSRFSFQMHYTTSGKAATDVTKVGLYFTKAAPKYPLRSVVLLNPTLRLPPNTKATTVTQSRTFDRDVMLYSLTPHSHFRGKASTFVAQYPDGRVETLLSVPKYDFNWQTTYEFTEPKVLPKGTKVTHSTTYDNSSQNKANPDPNIEVRWGEQSWEEMLYGNMRLRYMDEVNEVEKVSSAQ